MRRLVQLLLGIPITFASLALMSGGIQPAWQIFQVSILCTVGISLVVWIPLCWFVGWIALKMVESMAGRILIPYDSAEIRSDVLREENVSLAPDNISLANYIDKGIKQGWSETQITSRLRAQGWNDEEIAEAQSVVRAKLEGN